MSVRVHPQKERCNYAYSYSRGCSMGGDEGKHPLQGHRSFVLRCLPRNPPSLSGHSPGAMPARASRLSLSWTWRKLTNLGKLVTRKRRPDGNYNTACTCPSEACRLAAAIVSRICTCICVDRNQLVESADRARLRIVAFLVYPQMMVGPCPWPGPASCPYSQQVLVTARHLDCTFLGSMCSHIAASPPC